MKKLLIILIFCLTSTVIFAQHPKKNWFKITKHPDVSYVKKTKKEFVKGDMNQTKWIIVCLDKYRKERAVATQIGLLGVGLGGATFAFADKDQDKKVLGISAGVLVAISCILNLNAERNLNKKNLIFTGNGLSLKF